MKPHQAHKAHKPFAPNPVTRPAVVADGSAVVGLAQLSAVDLSLLPKLAQDWVSLLGLEATLSLIKQMGGMGIRIPIEPLETHALAHVLSYPQYKRLCAAYGGRDVSVPRCVGAMRALRDAKIVALYSAPHNKSRNELAILFGVTSRTIDTVLDQATNPSADAVVAQTGLF